MSQVKRKIGNARTQKKAAEMSAYQNLRLQPTMIELERRTQEHYQGAGKSISLLRADLLEAHERLADASCAGMFKSWLEAMNIPRSTAYFILGKKGKNGKFAAEGTGKWGADPKPLTDEEKKTRLKKVQAKRRKSTVQYLQNLGDEAFDLLAECSPAGNIALTTLQALRAVNGMSSIPLPKQLKEVFASIWKTVFPDEELLFSKPKSFNLAEVLEQEKRWKQATGEIQQIRFKDEAYLRLPTSQLDATIAKLKAAEAKQQTPSTRA